MLKEKITELIHCAESQRDSFYLIFISGDKDQDVTVSGKLNDGESSEIDQGFKAATNFYHYYSNTSLFVGDFLLNKLDLSGKQLLIYSTAQIGETINRRMFIPQVSEIHDIKSLTCNAYALGIFQQKAHYLSILHSLGYTKKIYVYNDEYTDFPTNFDENKEWIIKPSLECSSTGIKVRLSTSEVLSAAKELFSEFRQDIVIQEQFFGAEVEVPVLKIRDDYCALAPVELKGDTSNSEAINKEDYSFSTLMAEEATINKMKSAAENISRFLGAEGLVRIDFMLLPNNEFYVFDIAALPLISRHSSVIHNFKQLFPNDENALYKAIIGMQLINQTNN